MSQVISSSTVTFRRPTIVLANGCFDLLHFGHLLYLEAAGRMGDLLYVSVTRDKYVNKGPNRPAWPEDQRARMVHALRCVDNVILVDGAIEAMEIVRPDIFVKGKDYVGKIEKRHYDYCQANGIKIAFTDTPTYSMTKIINDRLKEAS